MEKKLQNSYQSLQSVDSELSTHTQRLEKILHYYRESNFSLIDNCFVQLYNQGIEISYEAKIHLTNYTVYHNQMGKTSDYLSGPTQSLGMRSLNIISEGIIKKYHQFKEKLLVCENLEAGIMDVA